jgi:hypothetical protein
MRGVRHLSNPEPINNPLTKYAVLTLAIIFEGAAWMFAFGMCTGIRKNSDMMNANSNRIEEITRASVKVARCLAKVLRSVVDRCRLLN